mmetsp:Transcript_61258/g.129329  ORF Transcript_61258/g.129329 Transcript_61258/m.129329 type:complete len:91 (-) Transcript_61258:8-280(-)
MIASTDLPATYLVKEENITNKKSLRIGLAGRSILVCKRACNMRCHGPPTTRKAESSGVKQSQTKNTIKKAESSWANSGCRWKDGSPEQLF